MAPDPTGLLIVPFLPSFGYAVLTGDDLGIPGLLILLLLLLLVTVPCGVVLGVLWVVDWRGGRRASRR